MNHFNILKKKPSNIYYFFVGLLYVLYAVTFLGIYYVADTTAGSITIKDGGGSGTSVAVFDTPKGVAANAGENWVQYIPIPGDGIRCETSGYATLSGVAKVTIIFG